VATRDRADPIDRRDLCQPESSGDADNADLIPGNDCRSNAKLHQDECPYQFRKEYLHVSSMSMLREFASQFASAAPSSNCPLWRPRSLADPLSWSQEKI